MGKTIEEKLQEQEHKLGLIAKGLADVLWVLNPETMKYTYISPSVTGIRGFSVEEVISLSIKKQLTRESYQKALAAVADGLQEFETNPDVKRVIEVEMFKKDGGTVWFELTARLAKEKDGTIKVIGISRDISQRKYFELEKEKLIRELSEALEEQKRLRHEIKVLHGLLPICAECKKIRDEEGKWWPLEEYIASRSEADFTHTICPECKARVLASIRKIR